MFPCLFFSMPICIWDVSWEPFSVCMLEHFPHVLSAGLLVILGGMQVPGLDTREHAS